MKSKKKPTVIYDEHPLRGNNRLYYFWCFVTQNHRARSISALVDLIDLLEFVEYKIDYAYRYGSEISIRNSFKHYDYTAIYAPNGRSLKVVNFNDSLVAYTYEHGIFQADVSDTDIQEIADFLTNL